MLVEFLDRHFEACMASDAIYGYIERHDEWENEELLKSYEYFLDMSKHYLVALECAREAD